MITNKTTTRAASWCWLSMDDEQYAKSAKINTLLQAASALINEGTKRFAWSEEYLRYGCIAINVDFTDEEYTAWKLDTPMPRYRIDGETGRFWTIDVNSPAANDPGEASRFAVIETHLPTDESQWIDLGPQALAEIFSSAIRAYEAGA